MEKENKISKKILVPFKKLSRITGYLISGDNRANAGKKAEIKDRVKHQKIGEKTNEKEA